MKKILIVEDDESQRRLLRDNLLQHGYSILEAKDGIEGIDVALHEKPDLILLDVRMPKMDGMVMMHKLRGDAWGRTAPIIILTNYSADDDQLNQLTIDMPQSFLIKSDSSLEVILDKIKEILEPDKENPASNS